MSSQESHLLLGMAFAVLKRVRNHFILTNDPESLQMIEEDYLAIKEGIERNYYQKQKKEREDAV